MPKTTPKRQRAEIHAARTDVKVVLDRLELTYGKPRHYSRFDPMEELVSCILSQHTADANSFPAFTRLLERYVLWEAVATAPFGEVADVIRKAGLANQKAKSIQSCLREIKARTGDYSIEVLREMPTPEARAWLQSLPGVGPKTAAIVLCFSFGRPVIPVDTHVFRVAKRLGFLAPTSDEKAAHDELLDLVPEEDAFRFHVDLIQHGRQVCRAPKPLCHECPITDLCPWLAQHGAPA